jgi:hypothetical protein
MMSPGRTGHNRKDANSPVDKNFPVDSAENDSKLDEVSESERLGKHFPVLSPVWVPDPSVFEGGGFCDHNSNITFGMFLKCPRTQAQNPHP